MDGHAFPCCFCWQHGPHAALPPCPPPSVNPAWPHPFSRASVAQGQPWPSVYPAGFPYYHPPAVCGSQSCYRAVHPQLFPDSPPISPPVGWGFIQEPLVAAAAGHPQRPGRSPAHTHNPDHHGHQLATASALVRPVLACQSAATTPPLEQGLEGGRAGRRPRTIDGPSTPRETPGLFGLLSGPPPEPRLCGQCRERHRGPCRVEPIYNGEMFGVPTIAPTVPRTGPAGRSRRLERSELRDEGELGSSKQRPICIDSHSSSEEDASEAGLDERAGRLDIFKTSKDDDDQEEEGNDENEGFEYKAETTVRNLTRLPSLATKRPELPTCTDRSSPVNINPSHRQQPADLRPHPLPDSSPASPTTPPPPHRCTALWSQPQVKPKPKPPGLWVAPSWTPLVLPPSPVRRSCSECPELSPRQKTASLPSRGSRSPPEIPSSRVEASSLPRDEALNVQEDTPGTPQSSSSPELPCPQNSPTRSLCQSSLRINPLQRKSREDHLQQHSPLPVQPTPFRPNQSPEKQLDPAAQLRPSRQQERPSSSSLLRPLSRNTPQQSPETPSQRRQQNVASPRPRNAYSAQPLRLDTPGIHPVLPPSRLAQLIKASRESLPSSSGQRLLDIPLFVPVVPESRRVPLPSPVIQSQAPSQSASSEPTAAARQPSLLHIPPFPTAAHIIEREFGFHSVVPASAPTTISISGEFSFIVSTTVRIVPPEHSEKVHDHSTL